MVNSKVNIMSHRVISNNKSHQTALAQSMVWFSKAHLTGKLVSSSLSLYYQWNPQRGRCEICGCQNATREDDGVLKKKKMQWNNLHSHDLTSAADKHTMSRELRQLFQSPYFSTEWLRVTEHWTLLLSGWTDPFKIRRSNPDRWCQYVYTGCLCSYLQDV